MYDDETGDNLMMSVKKALSDMYAVFLKSTKPPFEKVNESALSVNSVSESLDVGRNASNNFYSKYKRFKRETRKDESITELEKYLA